MQSIGSFKGPPDSWRTGISELLDPLGNTVRGRLLHAADPGDEVVSAADLLQPELLTAAVYGASQRDYSHIDGSSGEDDPGLFDRIAASRFTRLYAEPATYVALAGLAAGVGLDLSVHNCRVVARGKPAFYLLLDLDDSQIVRCAERPTSWPVSGPVVETVDELRRYVWQKLYGDHIVPLWERTLDLFSVPAALLWTNAAEPVAFLIDETRMRPTAGLSGAIVSEAETLLAQQTLPGVDGANPLHDRIEWSQLAGADDPPGIQCRRLCCITYYLTVRRGFLCENCPYLTVEDRAALVRERRDPPRGIAVGPARRKSISLGLARMSRRKNAT